MMKRCTMLLILFCAFSLLSFATAESDIARRYSYINSIHANLRIDGGTAYSDGDITPNDINSNYIAQITVYLQRNVNGIAAAGGSRSVTPGYEYRTYVVGTISDANGTVLERATRTN